MIQFCREHTVLSLRSWPAWACCPVMVSSYFCTVHSKYGLFCMAIIRAILKTFNLCHLVSVS